MTQELTWPVELEEQKDGSILVRFPDVPEALTEGTTEQDAMTQALDCLIAALGGYVSARRTVPQPSQLKGCITISLPVLIGAKIALYNAMRGQGVSNTQLARQLSLSEGAVRRLVDLDHRSHIGQIENALKVLGQCLTVGTRAA